MIAQIESLNKFIDTDHVFETALSVGRTAMDFAAIERIPRYSAEKRENDAEHSFMLGMLAVELAKHHNDTTQNDTQLDVGLVSQYATVHDLIELQTGDTPTFDLSAAEHEQKAAKEIAALQALCARLPPHLAQLVREYEKQETLEAQFVKLVDKLLPIIVDIISGTGAQVMQMDYGTHSATHAASIHTKNQQRLEHIYDKEWAQSILDARQKLADMFIKIVDESLDGEQLTIDYAA